MESGGWPRAGGNRRGPARLADSFLAAAAARRRVRHGGIVGSIGRRRRRSRGGGRGGGTMGDKEASLAHTPTWVVATVCLVIVSVSLVAERFLHYLGKVRMCSTRAVVPCFWWIRL
nr:unnamed protein product [Digitaria exilis]